MARRRKKRPIEVETLTHDAAKRRNIPTAELQSVMREEEKSPFRLAYARRNRDLDPQLVWRGKDVEDWSDLVVHAPPLYIQEKLHPKVLIDDLVRRSRERADREPPDMPDLFADFNGLADREAVTEFYQHDQNWSNRMILGDSLQVMASLAEREGLRGKVQCIYLDPPYGIKFNSNFQWSTTSRDVKDGKAEHITREPEQVRAFRDTWRDGIHSYLTYLRDRLTVARDLLHESGSIFVQIGDENVHRVRALMDEVYGEENFVSIVSFQKTSYATADFLPNLFDQIILYAKSIESIKYRKIYINRKFEDEDDFESRDLASAGAGASTFNFEFEGTNYHPGENRHWKTQISGLLRAAKADRLFKSKNSLRYKRYNRDFSISEFHNTWTDTMVGSFHEPRRYVVETSPKVVQRCLLMTTDPGDLVLDPTCGSGTTAYVAEQWGRRWITIDTSRVALALARARIMGARYPYYLLADSPEGQRKAAEVTRTAPSAAPTRGDIRQGFVYERVPHITLKSIANNAEIDVIWDKWQATLEPLRGQLNAALGRTSPSLRASEGSAAIQNGAGDWIASSAAPPRNDVSSAAPPRNDDSAAASSRDDGGSESRGDDEAGSSWEEWEIPRAAAADWPAAARDAHAKWWQARIARQKEIDASIAAKAEFEYLYDKPYVDNARIRVAGPFTVESLSPHRVLAVDEQDELVDELAAAKGRRVAPERGRDEADFATVMLEHLEASGVQQAHKEDRIAFTSVAGWPGRFICAEGRYLEGPAEARPGGRAGGGKGDRPPAGQAAPAEPSPEATGVSEQSERRAGIFIGPEFGTVSRLDLVAAAREAGDAGFDVLIACAFNYDAHSTEFDRLGRVPVLKARMNADLHMAEDLKNTGKGNLFVVFGEPDIEVVSGRWLVTGGDRMVICHDRLARLPGLGRLEEINRLGGSDLSRLKQLAKGRAVRPDQPDAPGGGVGAGEYRGRRGANGNRGVSSVSERGKGLIGGDRDTPHLGGSPGLSVDESAGAAIGPGGGNRAHALRPDEIAAVEALSRSDFPLSLTTGHLAQVTIHGVDVFHPQTGEIASSGPDGIACWFIDTDYNEESFFVRHAYFLGAADPYKALKTTLKAEIDQEAWESLHSDVSRPFAKPTSGRIAVKVINHLGDEVMKVFGVG